MLRRITLSPKEFRVDIHDRLYVEVVPFEGFHPPVPHPIQHAKLDPGRIYKVLGVYNPSETSEAYFMLCNERRETWYISNRHLRAAGLYDGDAFSLPKPSQEEMDAFHPKASAPVSPRLNGILDGEDAPVKRRNGSANGHAHAKA